MLARPVPMAVCGFRLATSVSASVNAFLNPGPRMERKGIVDEPGRNLVHPRAAAMHPEA